MKYIEITIFFNEQNSEWKKAQDTAYEIYESRKMRCYYFVVVAVVKRTYTLILINNHRPNKLKWYSNNPFV